MTFSEFAKRLYSAISGGKNTVVFTRELFESIVDKTGLEIIDGTKEYSLKNYYNGTNSISGIAKKINAYVDSQEFESYIDSKGDAAATTLARVFKDEIPDAEPANISQKLAEQFVALITDAATQSRKSKSSVPAQTAAPCVGANSQDLPNVAELSKYHFREKEIEEIKQKLLNRQRTVLALLADSGIGKSTIAREILNNSDIRDHYSMVIWVDYSGELDSSLLNAVELYSEISDETTRLLRIKEHLEELRSPVLLIVDNVISNPVINQYPLKEKGVFTPLNITKLPANVDILITTRLNSIQGYDIVRIRSLSGNTRAGIEMFVYHYNSIDSRYEITDKDLKSIEDILSYSKGNPFLIMLMAKQAAVTSIDGLASYLKKEFKLADIKSLSTEKVIGEIVDFKTISDKEARVLLGFSVLPNIYITADECDKWFGFDTDCVFSLADEGWIEFEPSDEPRFRMHDLIKKVIKSSKYGLVDADYLLKKDIFEDYRMSYERATKAGVIPEESGLFTAFVNLQDPENDRCICDTADYSQVTRLIEILKVCIKLGVMKNYQRARISHWLATLLFRFTNDSFACSAYYHYALRCLRMAFDYAEDSREEIKIMQMLSDYYFDYGYQLSSLTGESFKLAEKSLNKSLIYLNRTYSRAIVRAGNNADKTWVSQYIENAINKHDPSLINQALLIRYIEKSDVELILKSYARILDHWGYVITISNKPNRIDTAFTYLEIAYVIAESLYACQTETYSALLARIEDNLGYLLLHTVPEYYDRARELFVSALSKRKKLMQKDRYAHLSEYSWTLNNYAECLAYIGGECLDEAQDKYECAIELREELNDHYHGKYKHYIAWSNYGLGRCLLRKGQNKDAKTCFKTAYNIYCRLAKNEKTFAVDAEFVMNVDTYTNEGFTPWIGNHSHFN